MKACFILAGMILPAAVSAAEIRGDVKDALGRPLSSVKLSIQTATGKIVGRAESSKDGYFVFQASPGIYAILAEKPGFNPGTAIVTIRSGKIRAVSITLAANKALDVSVTAAKLEKARNDLSTETGSSVYRMDHAAIEALPAGENSQLNEVLLRAPGVVQDSFGQIHVRGDHGDLQYRINGVIIPEAISGFGQMLDTRFAESVDLLTGALPAQYGYRTAGIVEIRTKNGAYQNGGAVSFYGGSRGTYEPSIQYGGSKGKLNYYFSADFLQNNLGMQSPTPAANPAHDTTRQSKGFAYLSYLLNPTTSIDLILGNTENKFQIPTEPGLAQNYVLAGVPYYPSSGLNENQTEINRYGILALHGTAGAGTDYQVALFSRYSSVAYSPDPIGDLIYNGVASNAFRSNFASGLQGDGSYRLNDKHTLRAGLFVSGEHAVDNNTSSVFAADANGNQIGTTPFSIIDNNSKTAWLYGVYLQDEWRPMRKLTVNYGARYDVMNAYVNASQLSPRLGMVYKASKDTTLHAGYARYFTPPATELIAPASLALYSNTTAQQPSAGNSNVLPESSNYFDAGLTHQVTHELKLGLDGYYRFVTDLQDEGQFGQAPIFSPFNYQKGQVYGLEFTGSYNKDNFSSYLNLALSRALGMNVISGQYNFSPAELAYIADNWVHLDHDQTYTGSTGFSYLWHGTSYSMDAIFGTGLRNGFANTTHLPFYSQVNLGMTRKFDAGPLGEVEGRFSVINLFDKIYEIRDGSGIGVFAPQYGPRRGFYVGMTKRL